MRLKFCGADKSVTGSSHLFTINGKKILLDCGLAQGGSFEENLAQNSQFLFDPREIDVLVLSHAHIDHSGNIPTLVKNGFRGKIHSTTPTMDLCRVMLEDTVKIQIQDYDFVRRHFEKVLPPLYEEADVEQTMTQFVGHDYEEPFEVSPGVKVTFYDAGHVFGSAQVLLEVREDGKNYRIAFTGDLGRRYMPILNDPYQIPAADILITESTYASHIHDSFSYVFDEMQWVVNDVVARGGKIIIPGFSLERTQELIYVLHKLHNDKNIPEIPIFVDSPLSKKISEVFMKYTDYYDNESMRDFLGKSESPFAFDKLQYIGSRDESKKLNSFNGPCIIIAASGMCTGGRILHHLRFNISNPKNLILVVGFMAHGTLGRRIVEQKRKVQIFNEWYDLKADVLALNEFSAHADKLELLDNVRKMKGLRQVFIVHGENLETQVMRDNIYNILKFKGRVDVPDYGEEFSIEGEEVQSNLGERNAELLDIMNERERDEG
jgi:metallo-beta-lactamase family protein